MKKIIVISLVFSVSSLLYAKEPAFAQKQALFMMNYAQYATYKLKTYNNIAALEDEYKNLKDNMNLELIKDDSSIETINYLLDAIHEERKNNKNRERLAASIERRMNNAIYESLPNVSAVFVGGGNPVTLAINAAQTAGMMYLNYNKYKNQLSEEFDEKMWEYQQLTEDELNFIYKELNTYSHHLIQQYGISDEWRINEQELSKMFDFLKDENILRKFINLKNLASDRFYQHFPLFWYHLAQAALDAEKEQEALNYYDRFEAENVAIFRYDTIAVNAYKGKLSILLKNKKENRSEIYKKLKFIETNKTTWNDYYYCALIYASLDDINNARRLLVRNISELSALVDMDLMDKYSIQKIYTSDYDLDNGKKIKKNDASYSYYQSDASKKLSKNPYNTNYDGLELSRNLLQKIGNESIALASVEKQYKKDTASFSEALYYFGKTTAKQVAENSFEDIQRIKISSLSNSNKITIITCRLPIQWVLSSSTVLYAVFQDNTGETLQYEMHIDERSMRKLKKDKIDDCEVIYTTGKISLDWKKNKIVFSKLILSHPLYPVGLICNLNLALRNKNKIPASFVFNEKEYVIDGSEKAGSFTSNNKPVKFFKKIPSTIMNFFKNIFTAIAHLFKRK